MAGAPVQGGAGKSGAGRAGGGDDGDEDAGPGLMDRAELKAMLTVAKGRPIGCAVALTRDKQPLLLLHRTMRPRQVLAQLRKLAGEGGMALDTTTLRFGRAAVDGASDGQQLGITVNKAVPNEAAYARKLRGLVKPVGCRRCSLSVDESLDADGGDESGGNEDGADGGAGGTAQGGAAAAATPSGAGPAGLPGVAAAPAGTTPGPAGGGPPGTRPGPAAPAAARAPGTGGDGAAPDATGAAGRAALLAAVPPDLAAGVGAALSADPGRRGELAGLLAQVRAGVDGGDQAAARAGIAALREAVGAAAPPPAAAPPAAPDRARDALPRPGARDATAAPPLAVPGPPALAADAGLSSIVREWEAEQARAGQQAGQPPPSPAQPASGAAQRAPDSVQVRADVAAMMRGVDRRQAEGAGGGVQVAQAGLPGATTATDAGGPGPAERDGMTHWGSVPRPGSEPVPGVVRPAPDWRPLQGMGQVALGAAGLAVGGALGVVGAGETGLGLATTPLGGAGVPVTALGVATMGLGAAVAGGGGVTAYEGMGNILAPFRDPRPLPPGVLPPQDPAATTDAVRRWLADNPAPAGTAGSPAAPAPPVPDLSGARVGLGPVALSPLPPGLQGALAGNGGFTPAPPLPPLPGFAPPPPVVPNSTANPAPPPAVPSSTATPIPDGPVVPPHTGGAPPVMPPGMNIVESQADPGLTRPTGPIGGVPTGLPPASRAGAPSKDKAQVDSEIHVGGAFAGAGYRTEQQPTREANAAAVRQQMEAEGLDPEKDPDLRVEGRIWDIYTPESADPGSIRAGIAKKIGAGQTHRVAVDLRGVGQTEAAVRAALRADPVPDLKEIAVITEDGLTHPFRP